MKEKYIKRVFKETAVNGLIGRGFTRELAEALSARGVDEVNYEEYFGNKSVFHSPFEMANMSAAVETLNYVIENGGGVLVYGDYDADGLTAGSILALYFKDNGVDCDVIIPTREDGYGLNAEKVIGAFQNKFYDLVITVDCGISNAAEVEKIIDELGVEVIVTDHHELPSVLPNCICVNPKLGYPFAYLSGAGVAWKLVEALSGRETAAKYAELACIGTIADLMPMTDENRSIVKLGLANRNHKGLKKLAELSRCGEPLTCADVALKIAPKINAAGRVDSPYEALKVLLNRDKADSVSVNRLMELNELRKQKLDEIVCQADGVLDPKTIERERMVFLSSDCWQHGLLGIVASRYKEKFNVPAIVMTLEGVTYVGSARGVDGIDLYGVFDKCRDLLVKFGGHKASVGFSVAASNLDEFRNKMASVLNDCSDDVFEKRYYYDVELTNDCGFADVLALSEKLQPLLPQDKITCRVRDSVKFANTFGKENSHMSATLSSGLEIKGFYKYADYASVIKNGANVDIICSLETDVFTKNVCGIIDDITICNSVCFDEFYKINLLKNFSVKDGRKFVSETEVKQILKKNSTLAVFDDYETYLKCLEVFDFGEYTTDIFFDNKTSRKTAAVSPVKEYGFDKYSNIVAFCHKEIIRDLPDYAVFYQVEPANSDLYLLEINREICAKVFAALKRKSRFDSVKGVYDKYLSNAISYCQYITAVKIFEELEFIRVKDKYEVEFDNSRKRDLRESSVYRAFQQDN